MMNTVGMKWEKRPIFVVTSPPKPLGEGLFLRHVSQASRELILTLFTLQLVFPLMTAFAKTNASDVLMRT